MLAAKEGEDWIWSRVTTLPPTYERAIMELSRAGGDAVVLREFDLTSRTFVTGGFDLPAAKSFVEWLDRDTLLLSSAMGDGMATKSGYARAVRLWRRGADPMRAPVLFETTPDCNLVWAKVERAQGEQRIFFVEQLTFFDSNTWLGDETGPKTKLDMPIDVSLEVLVAGSQ